MASKEQWQNRREGAAALGGLAGAAAGIAGGYKGVKAAQKLNRAKPLLRSSYKFSRELGQGRTKSALATVKAHGAAMKGPEARVHTFNMNEAGFRERGSRPSLKPYAGAYGGGVLGSTGGSVAAAEGVSHMQNRKKKTVSKMGDTQLRHRRKVQGNIARTTSTLGLAGLGVTGAALAAGKSKGALRAISKVPKVGAKIAAGGPEKTEARLKNVAFNTGMVSGGIGGVGGFNQASIYSAEAKRRKAPVAKSMGIEAPYVGDQGTPVEIEPIPIEISKDWSPSASKFDSEASRHRRNKIAEAGSYGAAGGAGVAALHEVGRSAQAKGEAEGLTPKIGRAQTMQAAYKRKARATSNAPRAKALNTAGKYGAAAEKHIAARGAALGRAGTHLKSAGKLAAVGAGAAGVGALIHQRRKSDSWASYGKRDSVSAFGVDHLNPNGQPSETDQ